ncbi:MAG: HAD family phosphatase, partial [Planctomycetes bacterium]|nr:HAD family phosphatase [Planctomycetota bacterium]
PEELKVMADTKEALYREHLVASNIEPLPGVRALLADLKAAGIGRAVGSSTPRKNIETAMAILDLADFFDGVVTGDDVTHGKPHPEVFLKAAASVGAPPKRCIVIEDAPGGIQAAKAGGMFALAVTTSHPRTMFPHADRIVDSLAELTAGSMYAPATAP